MGRPKKYRNDTERAEAARRQARERMRRMRARRTGKRRQSEVAEAARKRGPRDPVLAFKTWAEGLIVPRGLRRGKPFKLLDWQLDFAALVFDPDVQTALLSVARKNGKSSLLGLILSSLLSPRSPLYGGPHWRGLAITITARLAAVLADIIMQLAAANNLPFSEARGNRPRIESVSGARLDFLTAGRGAAHGGDVDLSVIDEAGLLTSARDRNVWDSAQSSVSASAGKTVILGTRLRGDLFESALDQARRDVEGVRALEFTIEPEADIMDPDVWRAANPSLGAIKSLDYMRRAAAAAADDPSLQPSFRAHDLNAVAEDDAETIVALTDWKQVEVKADDLPAAEGRVFVGVDIGGSKSMTAALLLWESGRMEAFAAFPARPGIEKRGRSDGVGDLYARMVRRRELLLSGGRLVDLGEFLGLVAARVADFEVAGCGADRYRRAEVVTACEGTPFADIAWTWRGTGASATADGSFDVRAFQAAVLRGEIAVQGGTLLWPFSIASSRLRYDGAGNPALDRSRSRARQDVISAGVIACGLRALDAATGGGEPMEWEEVT